MLREFERVSPESVGIPSGAVTRFLDRLEEKGVSVHSFMLLRHDKVCAEGWWDPFTEEDFHAMFSFSKSLTSTAAGFAIQEGFMSLNDKMCDIFPEVIPEDGHEYIKKVTIRDLLTMSCGHAGEYDHRGVQGWMDLFMKQEWRFEPGTTFAYNTAGTTMVAAAVQKKVGMPMSEFLETRLFSVIGIDDYMIEIQPDGYEWGGGGFKLRTEDMAKFITFVAHRGSWDGEQILNREWFDMALGHMIDTKNGFYENTQDPDFTDWLNGYGFQFWICTPPHTERADGLCGQFGIIMEDYDAVLIMTAGTNRIQSQLSACWDVLMPSMQDEPLDEDPLASAVLSYRLSRLSRRELPVQYRGMCPDVNAPFIDYTGDHYTCEDGNLQTARLDDLEVDIVKGGETIYFTEIDPGKTETDIQLHIVYPDDSEQIMNISMGPSFLRSDINGVCVAAAGCWESKDTLRVQAYGVNGIMGAFYTFVFTGETIEVLKNEIPIMGAPYAMLTYKKH